MKRKLLIAAAFAVAGAGCATASPAPEPTAKAAERLAAFKPTGEKRSCLSLTQIRSIDALDDSHLLVTTVGGDHYLNVVSGRCSSASRAGYYIQYTVSGNQLCRNEIIRVIDNASDFVAGSCGLGDFEKLEDAPADES